MATREILNNGTTANDGTGDTLRQAADKINTNFRSLFLLFGDSVSSTTNISFDSDGSIIFENGTYDTKLVAATTSGSNKTITLPNATGTVVLKDTTDILTNKTLVDVITDDIHDSNDNPIISFNGTPDAVNHFEVKNGDSSYGVVIGVTGDSGDVDLHLHPLNNGVVHVDSRLVFTTETITTTGSTASVKLPTSFLNKSSTPFAVALPDGVTIGDEKKFVNINTGTATITPANLAGGTTIQVAQHAACSLIWSDSAWHLITDTGITLA